MLQDVLEFVVRLADSEVGDDVLNSAYDFVARVLVAELPDVTEDVVGRALKNIGERIISANPPTG